MLITSLSQLKITNNNSGILNFKNECPFRYNLATINNLISCAKLISSRKIIFHKELKNIFKKLSSIMGSLSTLLMNKLNERLKMLANKINTATLHIINKHLINFL